MAMILTPDFRRRRSEAAAKKAEQRDICAQMLALARRAGAAGMPVTAYLLEMASMEAGADGFHAGRRPPLAEVETLDDHR